MGLSLQRRAAGKQLGVSDPSVGAVSSADDGGEKNKKAKKQKKSDSRCVFKMAEGLLACLAAPGLQGRAQDELLVCFCPQVSVGQQGLFPQTFPAAEALVSTVTLSRDRPARLTLSHPDVPDLPVDLRRVSGRSVSLFVYKVISYPSLLLFIFIVSMVT